MSPSRSTSDQPARPATTAGVAAVDAAAAVNDAAGPRPRRPGTRAPVRPRALVDARTAAPIGAAVLVGALEPPPERADPTAGPVRPTADPVTAAAARDAGVDLELRLERARADGHVGEVVTVELDGDRPQRLLLVGVGTGSPADLRRAGAAVGRRLGPARSVDVAAVRAARSAGVRAFVEGLLLGAYRPQRITARPDRSGSGPVTVDVRVRNERAAEAVRRAGATGAAVTLARDLARTPSDLKSPDWLARQAVSRARAAGLDARVWGPRELAAHGFGGLLAVGAGSARPPRLVRLEHRRTTRSGPHVVLVGKGITFDSGGLSLKPADAMTTMKTDMSGAAAVLAVMTALDALEVPYRVTALLALAENMPGGAAMRPGDVITHVDGRTTEVLNTDAEGRLVLADCLAYADRAVRPDVMVDVATLTGAATLALGRRQGALFATTDRLATALGRAGAESGEPVWRMPLEDDYRPALDSDVADVRHIGTDPTLGAGAITAALYLREFVGDRPWAHLDIAGPARAETDRDDTPRGATGFGTRVLLRWLEDGARF
ncbi:MAG: leucyl aminopeptidase [Candidatus Nanopelagicales bacterium]